LKTSCKLAARSREPVAGSSGRSRNARVIVVVGVFGMLRVRMFLPLVLLFAAAVASATASLTERAQAAMLKVEVRQDQQERFEKIMDDYYQRCTAMYRREANSSPGEVDQRVPRLLRTISKDTLSKMQKVLDPKQMEAFQYALDIENRRFLQNYGVKEP
jgi:hypothetical protein